jgi:S-adenosylmethionine hydrolase
MKIITLTSDFGLADGYVGAMKGVILDLAADARIVDISHAVSAHNVRHAVHVLATAVPFFPTGTIHLVVVDPGVGSQRRGIALRTRHATFVGPDNGVFTPFLAERTACVALTNRDTHRRSPSATFHGRDIFAPVAAHLANGLALDELGPPVLDPVSLPEAKPERRADGTVQVEIMHVDHFGNLITNLQVSEWRTEGSGLEGVRVHVRSSALTVRRVYADVPTGELLALVGSGGFLEIAVREGSAARRLELTVGDSVRVSGL